MLCRRDYAERLVASFAHEMQSEFYCGNISVSIDGIALEHFSTLPNSVINTSTKSCPHHAVFLYFLSDVIKQDYATTTANSNRLIQLIK